ncbi:MAG TPA: metal ABC transporter permease [Candidatus Jeotgalibaca merdavium]|uniref:Metal ABC transporter permease n=1 Tax=Candidatus Jeotgalibaca merdavium TaxID=2838627 RepID=A0A9D2HYV5_9LACT|nr:metal ABC transporter permease [Candidatus Jeotgalibaca merdavium]
MALLSYEFMRRALMAAVLIAGIAPVLGVFLVIRRQSLMADTLSHVSLAGVALGFFININPTLTTVIVVVIAAVVLEYLRSVYKTYSEIATAILMSGGLALALILMKLSEGASTLSMQSYLFGSIITITQEQVWLLAGLFIVSLIALILFKKPMYVLTFDEDTAHVDGLPIRLMSIIFNALTGVAIAVMIPIAGALLISAIMVLPAAISMRLGKSFNRVILISIFIGLIGMVSGLTTSFYLDTPPGATITLIFILLFLIVSVSRRFFFFYKKNQRV